jgi:hypothetical protein
MNDQGHVTKLSQRCSGKVVCLVTKQNALPDVRSIAKFMHYHVEANLCNNVIGGGDIRPNPVP